MRRAGILIDTGMGILPILPLVEQLVHGPLEVVLTHTHWDHVGGLADYQKRRKTPFLVHEAEADLSRPPLPLDPKTLRSLVREEGAKLPCDFNVNSYAAPSFEKPVQVLREGDMRTVLSKTLATTSLRRETHST